MVRSETGVKVDRSMVVAVPDWDVFNHPKERSRSKNKAVVFEEPIENAENENEDQGENDGNDSIDEMVDKM
jgi:hypothetical protein